jgi:hypothetical protein
MMWIRRRFRNEEPAASGGVSRALKVMFEAFSPLTGEERGEGALIFCPLTLTLSRQGRENRSPCIETTEIKRNILSD